MAREFHLPAMTRTMSLAGAQVKIMTASLKEMDLSVCSYV